MDLTLVTILLSSSLLGETTWAWTTENNWPWTTGLVGSCNARYIASSGEFASPQYPNYYPNYADCSYRISSSKGMMIRLEFTFVSTEAGTNCRFDGIHVYDGPSTSSVLIGTLCGSTTRTFYSSGSDLTVVFYSDASNTGQGFVARWNSQDFTTEDPPGPTEASTGTTEALTGTTQDLTGTTQDLTGTTQDLTGTTETSSVVNSCRWNCGYNFSTCSCDSSCQYYGNCCYDYYNYCHYTTTYPTTVFTSCRWNCGYNFSTCSCDSSCQYYGNCCYDYYSYCSSTTQDIAATVPSCGGSLFGSGSLSSPNYPGYYHDNAYCVWQLSAPAGERIFLSFVDLELENCCGCDYVNVYDGSTTASPLLGKLCYNGTLQDFRSSSSYLTVLFRSDHSVVARGFKASFSSSLPTSTARVVCSSDNMNIVIRRSYLDSLGIGWHNLYVDDHRCRPSANSYEVSFNFPVTMCGTSKKFNNGRVVYNNHVRAAPSQSGEITRLIDQFLLNVSCHMEQDTTAGTVYKAKETINSTITGTGRFNATMAFYPSSSFSYPILEFPYEVRLNQDLFIQVQLTRPDNTLDLFLDTCVASPNHDFQARTYTLLRNGCRQDNTVGIYTNGQHYYAQFRFKAFKFLRTHPYVFLQCRALVCADNDYGSRCRQGCRMRRKRSLDSDQNSQIVTLGPITLKGAKTAAKVDTEE
ncbi:CUB and zona pellucida-like domain-containing protein 1 isoform X2 [Salminus brasiliensis]|uniref:CUB and zona pellucida-like domain-containing protein 1 isoform X2 n=1 Tax=Salminus brasiliensis TaxID=930266 RepID=UPI003B835D3D